MTFYSPPSPIYTLGGVQCGNEQHPNGPWHRSASIAPSWALRRRWQQWRNLRRHGCRCDRSATSRPVSDGLPTVRAPRGPIEFK